MSPAVDATVAAAERAGATIQSPPVDAFYGSRTATIVDPYGVRWMLATHLRRVSDEELAAARADFADSSTAPGNSPEGGDPPD